MSGTPNPDDGHLSDDLQQLSEAEERDLHFNGHPEYNVGPLHQLCSPGGCQYKTEAENRDDLDAWYLCLDLEPSLDDPEAEL